MFLIFLIFSLGFLGICVLSAGNIFGECFCLKELVYYFEVGHLNDGFGNACEPANIETKSMVYESTVSQTYLNTGHLLLFHLLKKSVKLDNLLNFPQKALFSPFHIFFKLMVRMAGSHGKCHPKDPSESFSSSGRSSSMENLVWRLMKMKATGFFGAKFSKNVIFFWEWGVGGRLNHGSILVYSFFFVLMFFFT